MRTPTVWESIVEGNPDHSRWYVERFRAMARDGVDIAGEARTVDAMLARGSRVLDAGCGPGRVGAALGASGHTVVGVDVDPVLVSSSDPAAILAEFLVWSDMRRTRRVVGA